MASSSPQVIFGALVATPGRYELCWITNGEDGEVIATTRKVVVEQHGAYFWLKFADENFQAYPCEHHGLRCDLLDPSAAWLRPVALELGDSETIEAGDIAVSRIKSDYWVAVPSNWIGERVGHYLHTSASVGADGWRVLRPIQPSGGDQSLADGSDLTARMRGAVGTPGLQAAG